jgi:hypothetical protein
MRRSRRCSRGRAHCFNPSIKLSEGRGASDWRLHVASLGTAKRGGERLRADLGPRHDASVGAAASRGRQARSCDRLLHTRRAQRGSCSTCRRSAGWDGRAHAEGDRHGPRGADRSARPASAGPIPERSSSLTPACSRASCCASSPRVSPFERGLHAISVDLSSVSTGTGAMDERYRRDLDPSARRDGRAAIVDGGGSTSALGSRFLRRASHFSPSQPPSCQKTDPRKPGPAAVRYKAEPICLVHGLGARLLCG